MLCSPGALGQRRARLSWRAATAPPPSLSEAGWRFRLGGVAEGKPQLVDVERLVRTSAGHECARAGGAAPDLRHSPEEAWKGRETVRPGRSGGSVDGFGGAEIEQAVVSAMH